MKLQHLYTRFVEKQPFYYFSNVISPHSQLQITENRLLEYSDFSHSLVSVPLCFQLTPAEG